MVDNGLGIITRRAVRHSTLKSMRPLILMKDYAAHWHTDAKPFQ
jgi:hypothetical protein